MRIEPTFFVEPEEHPLDRVIPMPVPVRRKDSAGDVVLYRTVPGHIAPARLVESAGGGCWLARDARGLIYLAPESIVSRLPRPDLVGEAA